jgi:hypothetical protein
MASIQAKTASRNILDAFSRGQHYAVLAAQCQSGKTGCYQELIRLAFEEGKCERAYILCGSNDLELYHQIKSSTEIANKSICNRITVLFRQHFEGFRMRILKTLIIVDESHLDQSKGQQLWHFMNRHGLSMDGTLLDVTDTWIVSVDATPYSELASIQHTHSTKHVEILEPGETYYGLREYARDKRILSTFSIHENPEEVAKIIHSLPQKYCIFRIFSGRRKLAVDQRALIRICEQNGFNLKYYTRKHCDITLDDLKTRPETTTVVIVNGRLRAGNVVPKHHVGMVWEGGKTSRTDALVQGLPGRMGGYDFGETKPLIYVPEKMLHRKTGSLHMLPVSELRQRLVDCELDAIGTKPVLIEKLQSHYSEFPPLELMSELDRVLRGPLFTLPTKAMNVRASKGTITPPIRFPLNVVSKEDLFGPACKKYLLSHPEIVIESDLKSKDDILDEIEDAVPYVLCHQENIKTLFELRQNATHAMTALNFTVHEDFVYVIFYVETDHDVRYPKASNKSIY